MRVAADIETDGIDASVIWCISAVDLDSDKEWHFNPTEVEEGIDFLLGCSLVTGHKFIGYDNHTIYRLHKKKINTCTIWDTLVMSQIYNPVIPRPPGLKGGGTHSLQAWGIRLGDYKVEHEDWSRYSPDMERRCTQDARLTKKLFFHLSNLLKRWSPESIRLEHDVTEVLTRMQDYGWYIDPDKTHRLYTLLQTEYTQIAEELKTVPDFVKKVSDYTYRTTKEGAVSSVGLAGWGERDIVWGDFSKIKYEPFNLNSTSQKVKLLEPWWSPVVKTKTGKSYQICEENLSTLSSDAPKYLQSLSRFAMLKSRLDLVDGWYKALGPDGCVHGSVFSCGAVTHRCAHFNPNLANIPGSSSPFGDECREVFTVKDPDNYRIVGIDADGIQLRVLAHYMGDPEYIRIVDEGDVHTKNLELLAQAGVDKGEIKENGKYSGRATAKTFIYAFLLGGGDPKLASICGLPSRKGRFLRDTVLKGLPALDRLIKRAKTASKAGLIKGIDGRYVVVKDPYYVLSALLQSGEAIMMKTAMVLLDRSITSEGLDARFVGFIHDEFQIEAHKDHASRVAELGVKALATAGESLGFRIRTSAGKPLIGQSWKDTH